jgi:ABC-2 type transport system ATP-binding protein
MDRECIIETYNLIKTYGAKRVIDNVNMHIYKGDIYGFVGKNGAGKTTIIRMLTGLVKPSWGSYRIYDAYNKDKDIYDRRKKIAAVVETPSIYLNMNARDNLRAQSLIKGKVDNEEIERILKIVRLDNVDDKKQAKDYSLGMRQRLGIAIALIGNPEILILDEPTNGLDPEGIIEIRELLVELNTKHGVTILVSSHILEELSKFVTCYGFIDDGKLIKEISVKEIEEECKKKTVVTVNSTENIDSILSKLNINDYKVVSDTELEIYGDIHAGNLVLGLHKAKKEVIRMSEIQEDLESYYMNLIRGAKYE